MPRWRPRHLREVAVTEHGFSLLRRVFAERRRTVLLLLAALVANVAVYIAVVSPLGRQVANVTEREAASERELEAARAEHAAAAGTLTGTDRATTELGTFYADILPPDLAGARRLTHLRLPQLAARSGLRYQRAEYEEETERGSALRRLRSSMTLSGSYADMRAFIHAVETAPEFVVLDNVQLREGAEDTGALAVVLELSTYYRVPETLP